MRALRAVVAGVLGLLIALGTVVLGAVWSAPPAAAAADPQSWVSIRFTAMTPSLPTRTANDTITLQGVVTNTSKVDLSNLQAIFWRSLDPIQDSEGMAAALASPADEPIGVRLYKHNFQNIPSETDRTLAPNESTTFSVQAKVSQLDLPPIDAIYLLGVHIRGRLAPDGPDITLGRGRVFAPVVDTPPQNAAQLSTVVVLDSRPSLIRPGVFADDHLADELAPDGRLTALLQAADTPDTSFAVDPSLIEEIQTMRAGYQVLQPDGTTVAGTGGSDASRWLTDYTRVAQTHAGFRELYGHPDVSALVHAGMSSVIDGGELAAKAVTVTSALPLLAIPAGGQADEQTVDYLAGLKPAAIVLDDSTTGASRPLLKGPDGVKLLNTATPSFNGGPGPEPSDTPVQVRQQALAETWLDAASAKPDDTIGQLRVIKTLAQARGNSREVTAPWLEQAPLSRLLDSTPADWPQDYRYPASASAKELSGRPGRRRTSAGHRLPDDGRPAGPAERRPARRRRRSGPLGKHRVARQAGPVATVRRPAAEGPRRRPAERGEDHHHAAGGHLRPQRLFPGHRPQHPGRGPGRPAAQRDQGPAGIHSANGQRLTVTPSSDMAQGLQVPAGAGVTGNAQVDAQANGIVKVTAQAVHPERDTVGEPMPIEVKATQAGTIGWLIAIARRHRADRFVCAADPPGRQGTGQRRNGPADTRNRRSRRSAGGRRTRLRSSRRVGTDHPETAASTRPTAGTAPGPGEPGCLSPSSGSATSRPEPGPPLPASRRSRMPGRGPTGSGPKAQTGAGGTARSTARLVSASALMAGEPWSPGCSASAG